MKKGKCLLFNATVFSGVVLLLTGVFLSGCDLLFGKIEKQPGLLSEGTGVLSVSFSGADTPAARTMLASNPEFTRYELYVSPDPETGAGSKTYPSTVSSFQLTLPDGDYTLSGAGFTGDKPVARTWDLATKEIKSTSVAVNGESQTSASLTLSPYMEDEIYGILSYSLNWDAVGQIPSQAELLIEQYNDNDTPDNFDDDTWDPIPISLIGESVAAGAQQGTALLLQRTTGLAQQSGSLPLPPGEYRLTTTVTMDGPYPPVSRSDIAHIFSNLTTLAAFFYDSGDLTVTTMGTDTGSGFITRFNFSQTPGAVSIVGTSPGPDGTRLIMVMAPSGADLTHLTPVVECASGAQITSPAPSIGPDGVPYWPVGDYSRPTSWTATGLNGVSQQYTVGVTEAAADDCSIVDVAFEETGLMQPPNIDQDAGTITVIVPNGTGAAYQDYTLTPVISWLGRKIELLNADSTVSADWSPGRKAAFGSAQSRTFRVSAGNGAVKEYTITIEEAANGDREITRFIIDGYPDCSATIMNSSGVTSAETGTIEVTLPYGVSRVNLKPLIQYRGKTLDPAAGVEQNFSAPKYYTVTAANDNTRKYTVTVNNKDPNTDTGIFDFVITNVPRAKVVIGAKPRADGKIPIIVSVPYATAPLIDPKPDDGPRTDLKKLIPKITLSGQNSSIYPNPDGVADVIPFGNQNDYQEAVYTVNAQAGNTQDYVVVVARDVQYYYVKATGDDTDPDQFNGGSESTPFKTLAYAVYQAVKHNVDHIYVIGTLNDTSEGGAWEDTSATEMGSEGTFRPNNASPTGGGNSVFNLNGAGRDKGTAWRIYITGTGSNAVLQGAVGKRVISVTGGAHITFDNITIQGGGGGSNSSVSYAGKGGGMYIGDGSTVRWKSGAISNNNAVSGGGIYVDNSEFDFLAGSIRNNAATSSNVTRGDFEKNTISAVSIAGGGGVYVNGDGLFWVANGEISYNKTSGSGGGVLVNGSGMANDVYQYDNFTMSGGTVNDNTSTGGVWPHGGGGVYVARGAFEMINGKITNNSSVRQGGGVFVWSRSYFGMGGNSSVTGNNGVGSSKAICNRGITTMGDNAQADKVYIWNYAKGKWGNGNGDEFTMMNGARITGLVLAFADDPKDNRNYINILPVPQLGGQFFTGGTDPITTIDLESHLTAVGSFAKDATIDGDWLGKFLIKNGGKEIPAAQASALIKRFPLGSFTSGLAPKYLSSYRLDNAGKLTK
jgi:hypothetical protein